MIAWEYQQIVQNEALATESLGVLGGGGWELVSFTVEERDASAVSRHTPRTYYRYIFKRPKDR